MPSYRPKSLEELNTMYDKKLAAENAMKKGTSDISNQEPSEAKPPVYEPYTYDESKVQPAKTEKVDDISEAVNDFIRTFGQTEEKKPVRVQQNVHPIQTKVKSTKIPSKASGKAVASQKKKAAAPAKKQERAVLVRNDERSELMDDYKKIMMDEDDDSPSFKERLSMKKKSKAEKKENYKAAKKEHKKENHGKNRQVIQHSDENVQSETRAEKISENEIDEVSLAAQQVLQNAGVIGESEITEDIQEQSYVPLHSLDSDEYYEEQPEEYVQETEAAAQQQYEDDTQQEYDEQYTEQEYTEQYEPHQQQEYAEEYEQEVFESFADTEPEKVRGGAAKVISLVMLFIMLLLTASVGALKYVVAVDTGKAFMNNYYVFTAKENFLYKGIKTGDLVISENKQIGSDDAFVYYDGTTAFRFAKISEGNIADSYAIIAENDNEQIIASSSNTRGVVIANIPVLGRIVGFAVDNFLMVFGIMVGACLLLIILTAILFAKGRKKQEELLYSLDDEYYEDEPGYDEESLQEKDEALENSERQQAQEGYENVQAAYSEEEQAPPMQIQYELSDDEDYDDESEYQAE